MPQRSRESLRAQVWLWPSLAAGIALTSATLLVRVRTPVDGQLWPGDGESASTTLQTVATAVITATSLTFSLVVVALQLASQQFSPRLLREFARDRVIQSVLAVLVATFVYALTVLRSLGTDQRPLPALAVLVGFLLGIVSAAALVSFLSHIARAIRVDTMMVTVHAETQAVMRRSYPILEEPGAPAPGQDLPGPDGGAVLVAHRSGFVQSLTVQRLVADMAKHGAFVRVAVRPGDHVTEGTPVATAWSVERAIDVEELTAALSAAISYGYERTFEQDVAFGFRQLSDIAVKALSPGINDPTTAIHALGHASDLLRDLQGRQLGPGVFDDASGAPRVLMPDRDHRYYLDLAIGQVRRYGAAEPTVLVALLVMLRDIATAVRSEKQRDEILRQVDLVTGTMQAGLDETDAESVRDVARRVRQVLDGDVGAAYADRSGETRSC